MTEKATVDTDELLGCRAILVCMHYGFMTKIHMHADYQS